MKNKIAILIMLAAMMTACGTFKKATNPDTTTPTTPEAYTDPLATVMATLGDWQTMQTGGNIKLSAGSSFSSSIQVRMVRDQAIFISLRPMLGIEVGRLLITADSLYAVDKVHKRYIAEKVSLLTSGIPVTVSDVQDIFLGRPFIIGKGTLSEANKSEMAANYDNNCVTLVPRENYKGYGYTFTFNKSNLITSLDIVPSGSTTAAYQVKYSDVKSTAAGNIAHGINANATVDNKKMALSLTYKNIDWNENVKIDRSIPGGYSRMSARDLFSLFSN
ncbi:MAG: DUF4292 domain-containing protein [Muribaculaceae bacterium]|nr:DUF4292 domain-containing protein [Muribaculaceae bacterium]